MKTALTCCLFLSSALALGACSSSSPSASTPPGVSTSTAPLGGSEGPKAPASAAPAPPAMPSADVPAATPGGGPAAAGPAAAGRPGGAVTVTAEQRACAKDDDCVGVQTTCCDVCNGGVLEAVNRSSSAAVQAARGKLACQGVACTMRACQSKTPVCRSGSCAMP